jgi:DnaJ family protein A protein 2
MQRPVLIFRCKRCKGAKVTQEKKRVEFEIDPGTVDGERIALRGEGDETVSHLQSDIIIRENR